MSVIARKIVDFAEPLSNELHEAFCLEYLRLDIEQKVANKKARRIKAYRASFPEAYGVNDSLINSRATTLLKNRNVSERIKFLYEEEGTSVENEYTWTRSKSEDVLVSIVYNEESKDGDRIKAVNQLNVMRGIDSPVEKDKGKEEDSVSTFFNNIATGDSNA